MPRPEPELTPLAWDDLDALFDAVLETSGSPRIAEETYVGVLSAIEAIVSLPLPTPSVEGRVGILCDYRWVSHKGWPFAKPYSKGWLS